MFNVGGYIYKNIQLFVSTFLSLNTPYNGLLLYHGVGVGKIMLFNINSK